MFFDCRTASLIVLWAVLAAYSAASQPPALCRVRVVDADSSWPVPLIELRTNHNVRFVSDNAGVIAFDLPELMGRETWFNVVADGYQVPADGFGFRGLRLTPQPGASLEVRVKRTSIARRLGRLTGAGQFGEAQKLGDEQDWRESGVLGSDSVQLTGHRGRLFWAWGDTALAHYPLGIFHMAAATTRLEPLETFEPPLRLEFDCFTNPAGTARDVAKMPGEGPTWLGGFASLPDSAGEHRLVATYSKIKPPLEAYEYGLCVWNDERQQFEQLKTLWTQSVASPNPPPVPLGHPVYVEESGARFVLFGNPLPTLRCRATFEAWQESTNWQGVPHPESLTSADDRSDVKPHSGSVAWCAYRERWVTVFMQWFGKPSTFGEVWYAEAESPTGPWGPAVKVLSHQNYTFYNPRIQVELTPADAPFLLFEGTYTQTFADRPQPTPRYDYNQILYRLDLDDPRLQPAQANIKR